NRGQLDTSLMVENVLSMCIKEAVTNVVRHSKASGCTVALDPSRTELIVRISDNGSCFSKRSVRGNGLRGMRERLEFVNGSMDVRSGPEGTTVVIRVPKLPDQPEQGEVQA